MSTESTLCQQPTVHKMTVALEGNEIDDLRMALEEVLHLLDGGFTSGFNRNDTGSFSFVIIEK
ncbi:MAG: hypothetical protein HOO93_00635 [Methyloglobulus sp.]|nr:hypothetical protein [Methyloglobulus sp.]